MISLFIGLAISCPNILRYLVLYCTLVGMNNQMIVPNEPNKYTADSRHRTTGSRVYFTRPELNQILNIYGRMVAVGVWADYAIDHLRDEAIFSIHRRASEQPHYQVIKTPALRHKQGMWRIIGMDGNILKRGHDLTTLLKYFEPRLLKAFNGTG